VTWQRPEAFIAFAVWFMVTAILVWSGLRHRARLARLFGGAMLERVLPQSVRVRRTSRDFLVMVGFAGAVLAWADPRYGERVYTVEQSGVDLVIAVDLSRSMDARDIDPSRLERARREIFDLIDLLKGDRVGLVIFAGGAYPRMPLTQDYTALRLLVEELDTGMFQTQGSAVHEALRTSGELLGRQQGKAGQAILVLSDGEVHDPAAALAAASEIAAKNIRVYSMGIGQQAAPIPLPGGNFVEDESGAHVLSQPSEAVLTDLARATGGAYVTSVASADDMARLYGEMRGELELAKGQAVQRKTSESAFLWPLMLGFLAWLSAYWLGEGRRSNTAAAMLLCTLMWGMPEAAEAASLAEADALYRASRYQESADMLRMLAVEQPSNPEVWGRLGAARYRAGDAEGAAQAYDLQDRLLGGSAESAYNAGNAHYRAGRLEEAVRRYDRALELRPEHTGAQRNKEVVAEEIAVRRQPPPKPPPASNGAESGKSGESPEQKDAGGKSNPEDGQRSAEKQRSESGSEGKASPAGERPSERQQGEGREGQGRTGQQTDQERDPGETGAQPSGAEGDPTGEATASGSESASPGSISAQQADRLLEGVEEGRPRIVIPDDGSGGKPW
jgi:Ca-activated chloride channel family protein